MDGLAKNSAHRNKDVISCELAIVFRRPRAHLPALLLLALIGIGASCTPKAPAPAPRAEEDQEADRVETEDAQIAVAPSKATEPEPVAVLKPPLMPRPKELFPESVLTPPEKDRATLSLSYDTILISRKPETPNHSGWQYRKDHKGKIVGFEFSNHGGNRVLPHRYDSKKNLFFTRDFQFRFDDRARQDIQLYVSDWVPSKNTQFRLSDLIHSVMYFFPRTYLPTIVNLGKRSIVTLPTGEEVEFDAASYEVLGGVLSEEPVDLNPNRAARKFPGLRYSGKGIVVQANARGTDPRLTGVATIRAGSRAKHCNGPTRCDPCEVPAKELWHQNGAIRFKFSTDEEFNRYLNARCQIELPKEGLEFRIARPHKADRPPSP